MVQIFSIKVLSSAKPPLLVINFLTLSKVKMSNASIFLYKISNIILQVEKWSKVLCTKLINAQWVA